MLDVYADMVTDWYFKWGFALFASPNPEEELKKFNETTTVDGINTFEAILSDTEGPYLLGKEVSYVDFALYHLLEDIESTIEASAHPHLASFLEAIKNRPNIKAYLATDRK